MPYVLHSVHASVFTVMLLASSTLVMAEEPTRSAVTPQSHPERFDRDGKYICGYNLMSESERGGHRSQLHFTKSLEDRDAIRKDLCERMRKRAQERGVPLDE